MLTSKANLMTAEILAISPLTVAGDQVVGEVGPQHPEVGGPETGKRATLAEEIGEVLTDSEVVIESFCSSHRRRAASASSHAPKSWTFPRTFFAHWPTRWGKKGKSGCGFFGRVATLRAVVVRSIPANGDWALSQTGAWSSFAPQKSWQMLLSRSDDDLLRQSLASGDRQRRVRRFHLARQHPIRRGCRCTGGCTGQNRPPKNVNFSYKKRP